MMKSFQKGLGLGTLGTLLLIGTVALIVVLTGAYNVAADDGHTPITEWALDTSMTNSVESRASNLNAPEFTQAMVEAGAGDYKAMCAHCHGGVGEGRAQWSSGMLPHPPALANAAKSWSDEEVFWLVKHGVKASGMPAFGGTHEDRALWNITAFVKNMPQMSEEQYDTLGSAGGH
jgi:mono/diheme cytochrome c family protein